MNSRELKSVQIDRIAILTGRDLQPEVVRDIASSIDLIGLQLPVSVVDDGDEHFRVISGRHRLAAVRSLGRVEIDAMVYRGLSDTDVRLAEIVENLHRAELTQLQRAEQIADYRRLATEKRVGVSGQLGQKPQGGRPAGGDSEAARELGLNRKEVNRAGKIADINPAAKIAAKQAGLDDNQSALLEVATAPHDKQADVVVAIAARKNRAKLNKVAPSPRGKNVQQIVENILREFSESDVRLMACRQG
jgi:ParB-like chromosome segregation protein Spo0J